MPPGPLEREQRRAPGADLGRRHRGAVVLEGEADDLHRLQRPGRPAPRTAAARPAARAASAGAAGSSSRSATSGRHRATSRSASAVGGPSSAARSVRSASPTSGSWRRSAGSACQLIDAPVLRGTRPRPVSATTTASPTSRASVLNAAGPPRPTGSPSAGNVAPIAVAPRRRSSPRPSRRLSAPELPGRPLSRCTASPSTTASTTRSVTAWPRSQAVPHQARRAASGRTVVTAAEDTRRARVDRSLG